MPSKNGRGDGLKTVKLLSNRRYFAGRVCALAAAFFACGLWTAFSAVPEDAVEYTNATTNWLANGDLVITFATGEGTLKFNGPAKARFLLVGGGGSGGKATATGTGSGGGGGAGGFVDTNLLCTAGTYDITVGAGGSGVATISAGNNGQDSSMTGPSFSLSVLGGGGGGGGPNAAKTGGSGGGASRGSSGTAEGAAGTDGQGNKGGDCGDFTQAAGGGGGAGEDGYPGTAQRTSGKGGDGKASDITGTSVVYAGGGGGAARGAGTPGQGGDGGGGTGAVGSTPATAGSDGLGGGGGGANNSGDSGKGGDGVVIVRISDVLTAPLVKPTDTSFVYDGTEHVVMEPLDWAYTIDGDARATDVGEYGYEFTVTLKEGVTWSDGSTEPVTVDWSITQAPNAISELAIESWKTGNPPNPPTCTTKFGEPVYTYSLDSTDGDDGTWSAMTDAELSALEPGFYWVRASVAETANYKGASASLRFEVISGPAAGYHYSVEFTLGGDDITEPLTNFPVLVRLNPSEIKWFNSADATSDTIAFVDAEGNFLPFEVDTWSAETIAIWVKVPLLVPGSTVITFHWGLGEGADLPENDPASVWERYFMVLHGNGFVNSAPTEVELKSDDGGVALSAEAGRLGSGFNKPISKSWGLGFSNLALKGYLGKDDSGNPLNKPNTSLSFYAWYRRAAKNGAGGGDFILAGTSSGGSGFTFWEKSGYLRVDEAGTAQPNSKQGDGLPSEEWGFAGFTYEAPGGKSLAIYLDDNVTYSTTGAKELEWGGNPASYPWWRVGSKAKETTNDSFSGDFDEVRIFNGYASKDWMKAEYLQLAGGFYTVGPTHMDGLFRNEWKRVPSISKTSWHLGDEPGVIDDGEALAGTPTRLIIRASDGAELPEMPSVPGVYTIVITAEAENYTTLKAVFDFTISEPKGYTYLATAEGRLLLAGDEGGEEDPARVTGQAYWLGPGYPTYWRHSGADEEAVGNLWPYTTHEMIDGASGRVLWRLEKTRIGNNFPATGEGAEGLDRGQVYLSWAEPVQKNSRESLKPFQVGRSEVGELVMRNEIGATVASGCFTNGIGTIYFDAANAWTNAWSFDVGPDDRFGTADDIVSPDCRLVVYIATDCLDEDGEIILDEAGEPLPPTDENLIGETVPNWRPVALNALKRDYPVGATGDRPFVPVEVVPGATNEFWNAADRTAINLMIANGGTAGNFYRIYIPLNIMGPVRFKIVRESETLRRTDPDAYGQILLDNVIVSLPQMRADLLTWPLVGEETYGRLDPSRKGKLALGYEAAWMTPFPSATDDEIIARAKPVYYVNDGTTADVSSFIIGAYLNYRWRYLDQTTNRTEEVYGWQRVALDPSAGFKATEPLNLPGLVGDVEFFYTTFINAPYYDYVDYSGTDLKLGGFFSEELAVVTNRAESAAGRDWFVRLRAGKSDYESMRVIALATPTNGVGVVTNVVEMELVDDHIWRGYYQTLAPSKELAYHFEALNLQTPGSETWNLSSEFWKADVDTTNSWADASLVTCESNAWATIGSDALTGYLLFQLDDVTRALTVVHADYQNFNSWHDANRTDRRFVGNSTKDDEKSGASPRSVSVNEDFTGWGDMAETNRYWTETFDAFEHQEYDDYVSFSSSTTPNGWSAGPGMWVYGLYRDDRTGRAFQMQGQGQGFLQYVDSASSPRGLKTIGFEARLGQSVGINDFCFYDGAIKSTMTNYTLFACATFDTVTNSSFSGNASLSMVGNYIPGEGCYEFRFEQVRSEMKNNSPTGRPESSGQRLALYRWRWTGDGKVETTLLGETMNSSYDLPKTNGADGKYIPMFLSVSADGEIYAGVCKTAIGPWETGDQASALKDTKWNCIGYRDVGSLMFGAGTYGVLAANCEGRFCEPTLLKGTIAIPPTGSSGVTPDGGIIRAFDQLMTIDPKSGSRCFEDLDPKKKRWYVTPGRMEVYGLSGGSWGLRAKVPEQTIAISTSPAGRTEWKRIATVPVRSFSSRDARVELPLYTTEDCSVKIQHVGDSTDMRTDVVIDNVELRQWRGNDWTSQQEMQLLIPNWTSEELEKAHTNFIFTSAWIKDEALLLSARRTAPGTPCSIRTPLFDGSYGRGLGLGMISFSYTNAQENVNLLVQVATNVGYLEVNKINNLDPNSWATVTNFDFSAFTESERLSGTLGCYVGLHGVSGVMRILIDPEVVDAVVGETDETRFGEITITSVFCRDEPALDAGCWWGWNLRTYGPVDEELRMYLPDVTDSLPDQGLSLALNNSISDETIPTDPQTYRQHVPFLQTPTFVSSIVGEVSFKARKYDRDPASQPAQITLFGSQSGQDMDVWTKLATFSVTNTVFTTYSYKTEPGDTYAAFRLAVTGVPGVSDPYMANPAPEGYDLPVRVLLDEVLVMEAVRPRVGFRFVGAFRNDLSGTGWVPGVPGVDEQPMCGESFGIQCEVYASQLPDEIDFSRNPLVRLYWIEGFTPWGFDNWRTNSAAKSAWLARATGTNLIYRSSYTTAPDAIITPLSTASGTTVQYGLEVIYYEVGADRPMTNFMSAIDWQRPDWYHPVDYNRDFGDGRFSAYCILDTVAPYWAWINEVNVFGGYDSENLNTERYRQFVEIAVPQEADITGWRVELLEAQEGTDSVITNVIGVFGENGLESMKKDLIGAEDGMVFRVIACSNAVSTLEADDGELDAIWDFKRPGNIPTTTFSSSGEISGIAPFGVRLVRASGVIEHEIVTMGTNWWTDLEYYRDIYHPSNTVTYLDRYSPGSRFMYVGDDDGGLENSRGVDNSRGRETNVWNNTMHLTPGRINEGQTIYADHPTPNGTSVIIYANLDPACPHILQAGEDGALTNLNQMFVIPRGSNEGTNIVYRVDPWYQLDAVNATTGKLTWALSPEETAKRTYRVTVGVGVSNNVTVVARAKVSDALEGLGITDDNAYKPAVLEWLSGHMTLRGGFADPDCDEPRLADLISYPNGETITNLTLTQMYWLDMDPTVGGLGLMPSVTRIETLPNDNLRLRCFAMITNRSDDATSPYYGDAWAPYVLRGIEPGSLSSDYRPGPGSSWTSETFKVTGILMTGHTSKANPDNWLALRWFVFKDDSFRGADDPEAPFTADVEINDPFGRESPGYTGGWWDWVQEHGPTTAGYFWMIDTRLKPFTIEVLENVNYYETSHE